MDVEKLKNKLIILEGPDRAGKSSIGQLLADYLNKNKISTILTYQPGDLNWGVDAALVRSLCKDSRHNLHPLSNFFAFQLDRVEQIDKIVEPALKSGKTVISDRWSYSTIAYQLYGQQLLEKYKIPKAVLDWLISSAIITKEPDYVLYFYKKVSNEVPNKYDKFDNANNSFMQRVNDAYEMMYKKYNNWIKIESGNNSEETLKNILSKL